MLTSRFALSEPGGIESAVREIARRIQVNRPDWNVRTIHAFSRQTRLNQIPLAGDLIAALLIAWRSRTADAVLVNGAEYAWPRTFGTARRKTIVVWHGTRVGEIPALVPRMTLPIRVYRALETWLQRIALLIPRHVAVSVSTIQEMSEAYGQLPTVRLVPNGATFDLPTVTRPPDPTVLAWVGTTPYKKGLDIAIDACRILRKSHPEVRLVAIGQRAETSGRDEPWIDFTGPLDHAAAIARMSECGVMLGTSRYEGCSVAAIEALSIGLPIVASPTIGWMIEGGGVVVDDYEPLSFARAVKRILEEDGLRRSLSEAARIRATFFDWEKASLAYIEVIRSCLE